MKFSFDHKHFLLYCVLTFSIIFIYAIYIEFIIHVIFAFNLKQTNKPATEWGLLPRSRELYETNIKIPCLQSLALIVF